jgi:hypothetical protein
MALRRTIALLVALPLAHAQASCSDECGTANDNVCNDGGSARLRPPMACVLPV